MDVIHLPQYVSPSGLAEFLGCEYKFYSKRMSGLEWPVTTQTLPADIGTAFDCMVKHQIANDLGLGNDPQYDLQTLLEGVAEYNRDRAIPFAELIFKDYMSGPYQRLMEEEHGVSAVQLDKKLTLSVGEDSVPVYIRPDVSTNSDKIVEYKVNGATSAHGASPNQGYRVSTKIRKGLRTKMIDKGPHEKCGLPLEELPPNGETWARQMAIYSWGHKGVLPWRPMPVRVEQISVRGVDFAFNVIDTYISVEFQQRLWNTLVTSWNKIVAGDIKLPVFDHRVCHAYNTVCEVSDRCPAYQNWANSDDMSRAMKS